VLLPGDMDNARSFLSHMEVSFFAVILTTFSGSLVLSAAREIAHAFAR
jgi:hypothetical protein